MGKQGKERDGRMKRGKSRKTHLNELEPLFLQSLQWIDVDEEETKLTSRT